MYLRPDEMAHILEKIGLTVDIVTQGTYGYRRGGSHVYVSCETRMGHTALVICPTLEKHSLTLVGPASGIETCDHYQ